MVFTSIIRSSWKLLEYSSDWLSDSTCRGAELETSAYETKWDAMTPWGVPSFALIVSEAEVDVNNTNHSSVKTLHYHRVAHLCTWYTKWTFVKQRYEMLYAALCLLSLLSIHSFLSALVLHSGSLGPAACPSCLRMKCPEQGIALSFLLQRA